LTGADLKYRIEELTRIKYSVSAELRELEAKRQRVQTDIAVLNRRLEEAKNEAGRRRNELDRLQISLQQVGERFRIFLRVHNSF
jgi:alpha-1,4-N-acetylglucosaminyltransferase EXTL3